MLIQRMILLLFRPLDEKWTTAGLALVTLGQIMGPNHYCMTSNHVPLISAFKMTFRMTFRMTFKTWDFRG